MSDLGTKGLSSTAMVLAAGRGTRMRPITDHVPKPLVAVGGTTMLDFVIDRFAEVGVARVAVNVHHHPRQIEDRLAARARPASVVSDERAGLLDSGGGAKKMLPHVADAPAFLLANADTLWIDEGARPAIEGFVAAWDPARMDLLLLVAALDRSLGFDGRGDFSIGSDGRLERRGQRAGAPLAYAGVAIFARSLFDDTPEGPFSLNALFDRAASRGRLHGHLLDGFWMHVGTPEALPIVERAIGA